MIENNDSFPLITWMMASLVGVLMSWMALPRPSYFKSSIYRSNTNLLYSLSSISLVKLMHSC